ncbi:protein kinase domain-containing protein [Singulisphaera sp. PoT]|uniref:protein kinase domain-containing protein n=1 Tax=Singulisphaera sp. PoT TaxID=3411797 RepID=UPI003BF54823
MIDGNDAGRPDRSRSLSSPASESDPPQNVREAAMPDDPRVEELLDELLDQDSTPEEVCGASPELLPIVRERWRKVRRARAELDALLPVWPDAEPLTKSREYLPIPQVPGYDVESVLGQGGMGVVFRARHLRLGRLVAIKMTLAGSYAGHHERERFRREAEAVAALRHPNVVQIYDIGDWAGRPYFTMELIEGGSLAQKLTGTPQPAHQAAALMETLARAMHAAHQGGIVHRDLKPANIMFTPDGTPKVTDFGLARRLDGGEGLTLSGVLVGTPSYMAPEQAQGHSRSIGPAVDIYSLGAILYELVTGRPPFCAETQTETVLQVVEQEPVPPSRLNAKVPRDLETICLKCLRKEPHGRYASAEALADDLTSFVEGRPIRARRLSVMARSWRWGRRNPALLALMATVMALIGLAIGGGARLEWERAERRTELARQDEREKQAVEAALEQASALGRQGHWPDARAVLEGIPSLLGNSAPAGLRERLTQSRRDARAAVELERIRLRLSTDPAVTRGSAATLYEAAFRNYGIDLPTMGAESAARSVGHSAIRDTLLAYLHDWFYWEPEAHGGILRAVLDRADDDHWRREFREAASAREPGTARDLKKLVELAASPEASSQPPLLLSGLGGLLLFDGKRDDTLPLLREAQQHYPDDFWLNYLLGHFWEKENPEKAVGFLRAAVAVRPGSEEAYAKLGRALLECKDQAGALAAFRKGLLIDPKASIVRDLARALALSNQLEEARGIWEKILEHDPPDHESWYGYAELCLFLGDEEAYRRARKALLDRFGDTTNDWVVAERSSLACLLLPSSDDELKRSIALVDRALTAGNADPDNAYLKLLQGLSEFRQGRPGRAIPLLEEAARQLPNRPGPRLLLSMARFQSGSAREARESLAAAVSSYNWSVSRADHTTKWVSHALRREAEAMILPGLAAFRLGDWQPRDNDERIALLGMCESEGLYASASRLWAAAFVADEHLASALTIRCLGLAGQESDKSNRIEILSSACRYRAACCAALAGCGIGKDSARLDAAEKARWRRKAIEWLRADMILLSETLESGVRAHRNSAKELLQLWQGEPDLAGLREPARLEALAADEREGCLDLWADVGGLIVRCGNDQ